MFEDAHKGHSFQKLAEVYGKQTEELRGEVMKLRSRLNCLIQMDKQIEANMKALKVQKEVSFCLVKKEFYLLFHETESVFKTTKTI